MSVFAVALHPEGVDRNHSVIVLTEWKYESPSTRRAWIEMAHNMVRDQVGESPSTRRAWIEIMPVTLNLRMSIVALHPEGVDRNWSALAVAAGNTLSPSTRRAWIEITGRKLIVEVVAASPSTRRAWIEIDGKPQ